MKSQTSRRGKFKKSDAFEPLGEHNEVTDVSPLDSFVQFDVDRELTHNADIRLYRL